MEKVCVLMTCYNPKKYILEQIDSIIKQEGVIVDLVIGDDCSTEKTWLNEVKKVVGVQIIEGENNLGVAQNILTLIKFAQNNRKEYHYFAYSDQDDVWKTDKLITGISELKNLDDNKPCLYYSNLMVVNENLSEMFCLFKKGIVKNNLGQGLSQIFAFACTFVFNSRMLREITVQPIELLGFDHLVYYIAIIRGESFFDDNPHIYYRQHGDNVSGVKNKGIKHLLTRMYVFNKGNNDTARAGGSTFKNTAMYLRKYFCDDLNENELIIVNKVADYSSLFSRIKIIFDKDIRAGYQPKDFYRALRLIIGNY